MWLHLNAFVTAEHTRAHSGLLGNGDNGEYMLSRKLLIAQRGVLKPLPPLGSLPLLPSETFLCCTATLSISSLSSSQQLRWVSRIVMLAGVCN